MDKDLKDKVERDEVQENMKKDSSVQEPDYKDLYLRSLADYQNMKNRMDKMVAQMDRSILSDVLKSIVAPLYNDLMRGVNNGISGCDLIIKNLEKKLDEFDVSVIGDSIVGKEFDTDIMSAVASDVTNDETKLNTVSGIVSYGLKDNKNDKTIAYANVIVYQNDGE